MSLALKVLDELTRKILVDCGRVVSYLEWMADNHFRNSLGSKWKIWSLRGFFNALIDFRMGLNEGERANKQTGG